MSINRDYAQFLSSFNSEKFHLLRDSQAYVLGEYSQKYGTSSDIAIELPTGAGKTLLALLIAEVWRQESETVAILSANKTLARQMLEEASTLGIPAVLMEGSRNEISSRDIRAYHRATKVAIMNYWVYFNQNPVIDPADLLIMDDAHLAEHCLHSLYSVEINKHLHKSLFETLISELHVRFPEYSILADAIANDAPPIGGAELLSFVDQIETTNRIRNIIDASPELNTDTDLSFRWNRMRNSLGEANIYLSPHSLWIRPYIYPLRSNPHYYETQQRIYMSATIGDPSDLSRRLGVNPITKIPIPSEYEEKTSGRRFIVMNRIEDQDIPVRLQQVILACLRIHPKSVWLCLSENEARSLQRAVTTWLNSAGLVDHPTWLLTPLGDEIDKFKKAPKGHLFVAGRFDGMDFNADECRLVVLMTLPRAVNVQEEFISSYLRDSGFMLRRLNQRIVQALGRCNRAEEDFGVYVLADKRFATHFSRESRKTDLPRNIVAEIEMAQDFAEIEVNSLVSKTEDFLRGNFSQYDQDISEYLEEVPVRTADTSSVDTSNDEVIGWTHLFASKNYQSAADRFQRCWNTTRNEDVSELGALYGWQWAKALYLQSLQGEPGARDKSLMVFEDAIKRGGQSSWFNRMRTSLNRARNETVVNEEIVKDAYASHVIQVFDDIIENYGVTGTRFDKWCERISNLLQSDSHAQFQEGLEELGKVLGYSASRPRYDTATDCRWRGVFGNDKELITFEAKIEHSRSKDLSAYAIGQAHNQRTRATEEYEPQGYKVRGTIVTHLVSLTPDAEAAAGPVKILHKSAVEDLWEHVKLVLSRYRDGWSLHDIPERRSAAQSIKNLLPPTGWFVRVLDIDVRFIETAHLLAEWPDLNS